MVTMNGEESSASLAAASALDNSVSNDDADDVMSESSSKYDDNDDMDESIQDEVTAQLAAAGPVGMAAAAAIASAKKRKRPHQFETNPSIRKRQQTRLLRKLRQTIDEFTIRVGMQAAVLVAIPGKPQNSFKCFGAKPLEDVVRNLKPVVMQDLESALAQHAPPPIPDDPTLHELPPIVIDGIPTPVEKMTQAQLRAFIPLMLKFSTGRGKPGWGKESTKPPWWPDGLPWANVRMDARTEDEKQKVSWTHALRQIVINCYKYHGREDLLPVFNGDPDETDTKPVITKLPKASPHMSTNTTPSHSTAVVTSQNQTIATQALPVSQFGPTVLQTISNPDGTVSIIQVDPGSSLITLPDGTTAQVQGVATIQGSDGHHTVQGLSSDHSHHDGDGMSVDLNSVAQATLGQEGQIILTGEDGNAYPVTVSGMITVPVPHNMYQTVVANVSNVTSSDGGIQQKYVAPHQQLQPLSSKKIAKAIRLQQQRDAQAILNEAQSLQMVHPLVVPKIEPGTENEGLTTVPLSHLTGDPAQTSLVTLNSNGQVVHNDKLYQLCEFIKSDTHEKVVMMTEISNVGGQEHQIVTSLPSSQSSSSTQGSDSMTVVTTQSETVDKKETDSTNSSSNGS